MLNLKSIWTSYSKVLGLLLMMVLGISFPQFHALSSYIQYLLMLMLFFAFLDIDIQPQSFHKGLSGLCWRTWPWHFLPIGSCAPSTSTWRWPLLSRASRRPLLPRRSSSTSSRDEWTMWLGRCC